MLVANAGVLISKPFSETTEADFDSLFDTNVKGVFFLIQGALPRMRDNGRIVTLSSGLSRFANPMFTAYSATKGAIDVMTRILAQELGARGITVNAIAPGAIDTDMNAGWLRSEAGRTMLLGTPGDQKDRDAGGNRGRDRIPCQPGQPLDNGAADRGERRIVALIPRAGAQDFPTSSG